MSRPRMSRSFWLALPAAGAILLGAVLLLLMISSAARLTPAQLQRRAERNLERGRGADAAIDYRRLLQSSPASAAFRAGLNAASPPRPAAGSP